MEVGGAERLIRNKPLFLVATVWEDGDSDMVFLPTKKEALAEAKDNPGKGVEGDLTVVYSLRDGKYTEIYRREGK